MHRLKSRNVYSVRLVLNGKTVVAEATPRMLLSDFLREKLGMTGVHIGCEHGVCGACTVRIDGALARACLTFAVQADGSAVDTVEGLAPELGRLSVLQAAFRRRHALQCSEKYWWCHLKLYKCWPLRLPWLRLPHVVLNWRPLG